MRAGDLACRAHRCARCGRAPVDRPRLAAAGYRRAHLCSRCAWRRGFFACIRDRTHGTATHAFVTLGLPPQLVWAINAFLRGSNTVFIPGRPAPRCAIFCSVCAHSFLWSGGYAPCVHREEIPTGDEYEGLRMLFAD